MRVMPTRRKTTSDPFKRLPTSTSLNDCLSAYPDDEPPSPSPYTTATAVVADEAIIEEDELFDNEHFVKQMNHSRMIYSRYSTSSNAEDAAEDFSSLSEDACEIVVDQTSVAKKKKKKTRMMRELESSLDGRYWKVVRQSRR